MGDLYNLDWLVPSQDVIDWANGKNRIVQSDVDTSSYAWHNAITKGLGALNGINGVLGVSLPATKTRETPMFNYGLQTLRSAGTMDYDDKSQLLNAHNLTNFGLRKDYDVVRGMNTAQKLGTAGSAGLSGAMALGSIAPGWGHAAGFALGAATGALAVSGGDTNAYNDTLSGNNYVNLARLDANGNLQNQADKVADYSFRSRQSHVVKNGGQIHREQREQEDIQHFAERVLGKKSSILPQRVLCKGGVRVKIKR